MKSIEAVIFDRDDLALSSKNKELQNIGSCDLKQGVYKSLETYGVALFIDKDQKTKILKNRFGDNGSGFILDFTNIILDEVLKEYNGK